MTFLRTMDPHTGFMPPVGSDPIGKELTERYNSASPFPHVVIDDFMPVALLNRVLERFREVTPDEGTMEFDRDQERFKRSFQPDGLDNELKQLFYAFNARPFIKVMENITGIRGLIPDPYFLGAGIHEIRQGGHLSVHADFNHHKPMNLERRVNVLIYLNKDWEPDYGGGLELWDEAMTRAEHDIVPAFNRCVIFNTTSNSMHGNPRPIAHPEGVSRKSIALYYYTSTWNAGHRSHTTQFQVRPGSKDRFDWRVRCSELAEEYLPPVIARRVNRLL